MLIKLHKGIFYELAFSWRMLSYEHGASYEQGQCPSYTQILATQGDDGRPGSSFVANSIRFTSVVYLPTDWCWRLQ